MKLLQNINCMIIYNWLDFEDNLTEMGTTTSQSDCN